jgi:hypothetical protein
MDKSVFTDLEQSLALDTDLPTHKRFRYTGVGRVALTLEQVSELVDYFLQNPCADSIEHHKFIQVKYTFSEGSGIQRTGYNLRPAANLPEIVDPEFTSRWISLKPGVP